MENSYFGIPDASAEEEKKDILKNYTSRQYDSSIKAFDNKTGVQVIVGIKGSGKTCIRTYIEEKDKGKLFFNLNSDNGYLTINAEEFSERSGRLKNIISIEILRCFAYMLSINSSNKKLSNGLKQKLNGAVSNLTTVLGNIPDAIDISTPVGTIKLKELFKSESSPIVQNALKDLLKDILESLEEKEAYIVIDDAEDVFYNLEKNSDFIEAVVRAVYDINKVTEEKVHVLLFLKYGLYRYWFENQKEFDRVRHIIQIITWDHDKLCELIALRIATKRNIKKKTNLEELWALEFEWNEFGNFNLFSKEITKLCISGPRDMIYICNLAKVKAKNDKISISHINSVLKEYSESQIYEIGANFGDVYKDIEKFIDRVFHKSPAFFTGKEMAVWIEQKALLNKKVDNQFNKFSWYSDSGKERIVNLMYKIGFIGIKKDLEYVYSIENPNINTEDLLSGNLSIHPAFRPHLSNNEK